MKMKGNPVSHGVALGSIYRYEPFQPNVKQQEITSDKVTEQTALYDKLKAEAAEELRAIRDKLQKTAPDKAKIFEAHLEILGDEDVDEMVLELITDGLFTTEYAVSFAYDKFAKLLGKAKDELIRERVADLHDVRNRLLRIAAGAPESNLSSLEGPVIVAAHDLLPSDTATLDRANVLAIVTEIGGATSHSAIIARSYEIPAILGIDGLLKSVKGGEFAAADALDGYLVIEPDEKEKADYTEKRDAFLKETAEIKEYLGRQPLTKDGVKIEIGANVGSADAHDLACEPYVDLIGLFRTEFLYMAGETLPSEEKQFETYKKILTAFGDRPVTLRTLDIGGDKTLPALPLPKEDNPFLGKRALRLCFDRTDIFRTQLRAALRASVYGNLWLMLPMVGSMDDIRRARAIVDDVKAELIAEGKKVSDSFKFGIMIEIPSIAVIADIAVKEVDFASIGTNDLCQYLTAVDRMNPSVVQYYQSYHPAMFRMIGYVVKQFNEAGKPICVCGELGGDPLAAPVLVGLGMRKLSMSFSCVARMKKLLSGLTIEKAQSLAAAATSLDSAEKVEQYLKKETAAF